MVYAMDPNNSVIKRLWCICLWYYLNFKSIYFFLDSPWKHFYWVLTTCFCGETWNLRYPSYLVLWSQCAIFLIDCVGIKRHVNPCESFCDICQRKGEKREWKRGIGKKEEQEWKGRNGIKTFSSTLTCYKDSKPCPTVSQYQLDAPVT